MPKMMRNKHIGRRTHFGSRRNSGDHKIHDTLSNGYFNDKKDYVDVSDGDDDLVHIIVVSRKFNGYTMKGRGDIIWQELFDHLSTEEWGNVTLSIGMIPEEVRF